MQVPEVETVFTCTGQGEDITQQQSFAQLQVKLRRASATAPRPRWPAGRPGADIPGVTLRPGVPSAGGGSAQPIQLQIFAATWPP